MTRVLGFNIHIVVIIIFLVRKCNAKINITINAASTIGATKIKFHGADNKVISKKDIYLYNVTTKNLEYGVRVELGKYPDDVFLKNPTQYGDLFQKYNWRQVHRTLSIKDTEIDGINIENVVLIERDFINNTTSVLQKRMEPYERILEYTTKSYWSDDGYPEDDVSYNINMTFNINHFNFENRWRNINYRIIPTKFGVKGYGVITIDPGKTATVKLLAKKAILLVKIKYKASLTGQLIANYAREYGKYHFWAPSISNIMKAAKIKNELFTTETKEIKFYTDPHLEVRDKGTGNKIPVTFTNVPFRKRRTRIKVLMQ